MPKQLTWKYPIWLKIDNVTWYRGLQIDCLIWYHNRRSVFPPHGYTEDLGALPQLLDAAAAVGQKNGHFHSFETGLAMLKNAVFKQFPDTPNMVRGFEPVNFWVKLTSSHHDKRSNLLGWSLFYFFSGKIDRSFFKKKVEGLLVFFINLLKGYITRNYPKFLQLY